MADYRHAGCGFPNGAVSNASVFALPSPDLLMLATEGRYHLDAAVRAGKRVLWRAVPRIGKRPAELGWSPAKFVTEALNLTDEPTLPIYDFVFANELDLNSERGDGADDWSGLDKRYALIGGWGLSVVHGLRAALPGTLIHWPAWTPDHDALGHLDAWRAATEACQVIDFHAYDSLAQIEAQYHLYRQAFPTKALALTEWHCKGDVEEERRVLTWLAETMAADPLFDAAYFFIWRWWNHPGWWSDDWDIEHSPDRLSLFTYPPVVAQPAPAPVPEPIPPVEPTPMTKDEIVALISQVADENGIDRAELLGGAIAESNLNPSARRPFDPAQDSTYFPDVSFGLFQQTARWAMEGDQSVRPENIRLIETLYSDPWHAARVAAAKFKAIRPNEATALDAWCRYNWPAKTPADNPNRGNYANGLDEAQRILGAVPMPDRVTYNAGTPAIAQNDPWSCSTTSLRWALTALGRHPAESWIEDTLKAEGVVTEADGLLDATGKGLADFVTRQYGEFGFYANNESSVTFDGVALEGDHAYPLLIGGRAWGHWSGCSGYDAGRDVLLLANPADGWQGVGQTMNRGQFASLGPFSMVRVLHPDLLVALPPAPPVPAPMPQPTRAHVLVQEIRERLDELAALVA